MKTESRFILAIATVFVLQVALCPAVCLAGNPVAVESQTMADSSPVPAPSRADAPCHQSSDRAPQNAPADGDDSPSCTSCSSPDVPLAHAAAESPGSWSLTATAFSDVIAPAPIVTALTPRHAGHEPPPVHLFLLNNSFLL